MAIRNAFLVPVAGGALEENPKRGIALMLISVLIFGIMNVAVKYIGTTYSAAQLAFFRNLFAMLPVFIMVMSSTGLKGLRTTRWRMHLFRGTAGTLSILFFFYSFRLLPLADAVAFNFAGPLFVALFSMLLLNEQVGRFRWATLLAGFMGVLIMVEPWQSHQNVNWLGALNGMANAFFYGFSIIGVRSLGKTESHATIVFYFTAISVVYMSFVMPFVWLAPSWSDFLILAIIGILAGIGQLFVTRAFQYAPASVVSPFSYASLFWAVLFGYLFWDEVPSWSIFTGGGVMIAAGLLLFYRETHPKKTATINEIDDSAIDPEG